MVRDAIVSKILTEDKTSTSLMVQGEDSKKSNAKRKINLYKEGLSMLEDKKANTTETTTDNGTHTFIQYQEVGTINNVLNTRFETLKTQDGDYATTIKMKVVDESTDRK